jgi:hypothetical protein
MATDTDKPVIALGGEFKFGPVDGVVEAPIKVLNPPPPLGPLNPMVGAWKGSGFNTIFRPLNPASPVDPKVFPVKPTGDNVLELNLTSESLVFTAVDGDIPNRGMVMPDINLHGMIYLQQIKDVTTAPNVGIHIEPGIWVVIPATTNPHEGQTVCRMASIPHGTTINAQGTTAVIAGPPNIPAVDITPHLLSNNAPITFPSQKATNQGTPRIPQDLSSFIASEKITQKMLDNPNSVLQSAIAGQKIVSTTVISISTAVVAPVVAGGGTDNIAFLINTGPDTVGSPNGPNAHAIQMNATFWIETVERDITIPVFKPGDAHPTIALPTLPGHPPLSLSVDPGRAVLRPTPIKLHFTQLQYSQTVFLNFNGLRWPHVSVATLVPASSVPVPPAAWPT